ncbi:MAG TPA: RNA polymerase sigma factor [Solirubrobacterales bacterium]|jgi:DNA-directed RNA polymerase specialized sigma24 family protein|nr:RNA polymerase sigma factor [Solirubrobacterales bacterium]
MAAQAAARNEVRRLAAQLFQTHHGRLLGIARRNCGDTEIGEEALQDAFVLFIDNFDPACDSPPLAWLTLTLKRRCWALYRHRRPLRPLGGGAPEGTRRGEGPPFGEPVDPRRSPAELAEAEEALRGRRARLAALKPAERRALGLFALGYSYGEIGKLTGWTYTKVRRSIYEGRVALREGRREEQPIS